MRAESTSVLSMVASLPRSCWACWMPTPVHTSVPSLVGSQRYRLPDREISPWSTCSPSREWREKNSAGPYGTTLKQPETEPLIQRYDKYASVIISGVTKNVAV